MQLNTETPAYTYLLGTPNFGHAVVEVAGNTYEFWEAGILGSGVYTVHLRDDRDRLVNSHTVRVTASADGPHEEARCECDESDCLRAALTLALRKEKKL